MSKSTAAISESRRQIVHRTRGLRHGAITRLMSPSDVGQILKPFVFLDLFDSEGTSFSDMALHPHSGIATLTYMIEGSVRYEDTSGSTGILPEGGVEWFKAGHGAWHGGGPNGSASSTRIPALDRPSSRTELGPVESIYQAPETVQRARTRNCIARQTWRRLKSASGALVNDVPVRAPESRRILELPAACRSHRFLGGARYGEPRGSR